MDELNRLEGTPEELVADEQFMQLVMPALRADFQICETYSYEDGSPLPISIHAFRGDRDAITAEDVGEWRLHTSSSFSSTMLPGNHFFMETAVEPLVSRIQSIARRVLEQECE